LRVHVRCPAKVNLHLQVLGRRSDGYHELRTIFAAVGEWDELTLEGAPAGVLELTVEPAGVVPAGDDNLVVTAARLLAEKLGASQGARMGLRKGIPVAGGLGGGSSDAAATLVGLACLWGSPQKSEELEPLAETLGADVPFFLTGGVGLGVGRGSEVTPLPDLPPWWLVLLPGPEPISTAEVYRALDASLLDAQPASEIYQWVTAGGEFPVGSCRNDLQPTVVRHWPEIGRRLERARATQPLLAMLSGSGGTVFGLYEDETRARRAAGALGAFRPKIAPLLGRRASLLRPVVMEE
jgi:4-diphosphocytidyl-2-C-methyl-D-erythritol kinase